MVIFLFFSKNFLDKSNALSIINLITGRNFTHPPTSILYLTELPIKPTKRLVRCLIRLLSGIIEHHISSDTKSMA